MHTDSSPPTPAPQATSFSYEGEPALREPIAQALMGVVDPEVALSIMDLGLVYRVQVTPERADVRMTMTSATCPMADLIVDDVHAALARVLPPSTEVQVELCWEPPWSPAMMSTRARSLMRW